MLRKKMNNILDYKYLRITKYFKRCFSSSFVTTPIFYVNAAPHIGHLYSALIADAYHRFQLLKYPDKNVIFSTGTDEHGLKVQQAANSMEWSVIKEYCDKISIKYKTLFDLYGIDYTYFIRTTDVHHKHSVQTFWNTLDSKGFIRKGKYTGWYCVSDEMFLSEDQLTTRTDQSGKEIKVSEISGHPVEWNEEENFMFKLSQVKDDLLYWLKDETKIVPYKFYKILQGWLNEDYLSSDISISRPSSRIPWGIPVPNHPTQTVYVWLDALVNYLTVAGYPDLKTWPPTVQIVGKDILKFHGIYWPAFLIAAGLDPPAKLFVHSHWTVDDEKMSKSKNNVVDPYEKIKTYTASGFRYFLLKEGVPHSDGNYNEMQVVNMLNADLANTLGNLLNRCSSKTVNSLQIYPHFDQSQFQALFTEYDTLKKLTEHIYDLQVVVSQHYEELHFYKGIYAILDTLYLSNKLIEESKPWELRKNPAEAPKLSAILHVTMETLRICGIALLPIVPEISQHLFKKLNLPTNKTKWQSMIPSWSELSSDNVDISLSNESVILYKKIQTK